eukprot:GEMP01033788.1.p1 GENE.GEMP01033788.1~~GEMP01033788.1.p1  ORF type:complete len:279 (+),score=21.38 GEMP01033788.1:76-912(+)
MFRLVLTAFAYVSQCAGAHATTRCNNNTACDKSQNCVNSYCQCNLQRKCRCHVKADCYETQECGNRFLPDTCVKNCPALLDGQTEYIPKLHEEPIEYSCVEGSEFKKQLNLRQCPSHDGLTRNDNRGTHDNNPVKCICIRNTCDPGDFCLRCKNVPDERNGEEEQRTIRDCNGHCHKYDITYHIPTVTTNHIPTFTTNHIPTATTNHITTATTNHITTATASPFSTTALIASCVAVASVLILLSVLFFWRRNINSNISLHPTVPGNLENAGEEVGESA